MPEDQSGSGAVEDSGSTRAARLNQPWRGALAVVEVLVAVLFAVAVPWVWQRGIVPIELEMPGSAGTVTRYVGSWLAIAIGMGTAAALLLLNALRQLLLALRGA